MYDAQAPFGLLDVVAFGLTILALAYTVFEAIQARRAAKKAQTAADQAREAVVNAEAKLANDGLMVSLSDIKSAVGLVQHASDSLSHELMRHALVQFGTNATAVAKRLDKHGGQWDDFPLDLQASASRALDLKERLMKNTSLDVAKTSVSVRAELDRIHMRITEIQTDLSTPNSGVVDA